MFIQIHSLTSYPAALLNRDDSNLAKRLRFGDTVRTRVSSQCLKRHWRTRDDAWSLRSIGPDMAVRSRHIPEREIEPALAGIGTEETRRAVIDALAVKLYSKTAVKDSSSRQALLIGKPEIAYLTQKAREAAAAPDAKSAVAALDAIFKEEKANLSALLQERGALHAGLEAALFGRMMTSDPGANTDAAIHVAHAFTVHTEQAEMDYFTVVDDLAGEGETGAGGIFDTELTAGLFYGYVVVDVRTLVDNLGGDRALAARVVQHLVHLIAKVSPGAKKGSTAPYAYASCVLVEAGERQPRTLANAFQKPVAARDAAAVEALFEHVRRYDAMYGAHERRAAACLVDLPEGVTGMTCDDLAAFAASGVAPGVEQAA